MLRKVANIFYWQTKVGRNKNSCLLNCEHQIKGGNEKMVSEKIKQLRKQAKMSQEGLAEKLGVSRQAVTKWETGGGVPDVENLIAIVKLFQISLDELVSGNLALRETPEFLYESTTEYDIDGEKSFDITFMGGKSVVLRAYEGEKLKVNLSSNQIANVQSAFKVKLDDVKKKLDVDIKRLGQISEAEAKASLVIFIDVPKRYGKKIEVKGNTEHLKIIGLIVENIEYTGKLKDLEIIGVSTHLEIDSNEDMNVRCRNAIGKLDMNQISSTSKMSLDNEKVFFVTKGFGNHIIFKEDCHSKVEDEAEADFVIELNGVKSELTIETYREKVIL